VELFEKIRRTFSPVRMLAGLSGWPARGIVRRVPLRPDKQTVGCMVAPPTEVALPAPSLKLDIYLMKGGEKRTIEPGAPILDWHFWEEGRAAAVHSGVHVRQGTYTLYESATARVIEELAEPADESTLPPWAKSQAQIQDEAVPMSAALTQERTGCGSFCV
jgi:hypothetical protein